MFRRKAENQENVGEQPALNEDMMVIVDQAVNPFLVLFHDPISFRAEQIRALRNQLIALNPDGAAKTLVVTSAIKGEGKTVTAINLALAFAELDRQSVLLIDADLRQPSVEKYLNLSPHAGVSDLFLDRVSFDDSIRSSGTRNLSILGAGTRMAAPSELLTGSRLEQLFARAKERFQYVVIDTPPVLPATDASVIAARADGTLLTVRLEHSQKKQSKDAVRYLQDLGANMLGTFVTEVRGADPDSDPTFRYEALEEP
ncbi:MAG: CpsD/CapB family tyrosine-protein kinase [Planctomycetota bacterium]|jgi:capsular exopolysaccharide synthesis family protein